MQYCSNSIQWWAFSRLYRQVFKKISRVNFAVRKRRKRPLTIPTCPFEACVFVLNPCPQAILIVIKRQKNTRRLATTLRRFDVTSGVFSPSLRSVDPELINAVIYRSPRSCRLGSTVTNCKAAFTPPVAASFVFFFHSTSYPHHKLSVRTPARRSAAVLHSSISATSKHASSNTAQKHRTATVEGNFLRKVGRVSIPTDSFQFST